MSHIGQWKNRQLAGKILQTKIMNHISELLLIDRIQFSLSVKTAYDESSLSVFPIKRFIVAFAITITVSRRSDSLCFS